MLFLSLIFLEFHVVNPVLWPVYIPSSTSGSLQDIQKTLKLAAIFVSQEGLSCIKLLARGKMAHSDENEC